MPDLVRLNPWGAREEEMPRHTHRDALMIIGGKRGCIHSDALMIIGDYKWEKIRAVNCG